MVWSSKKTSEGYRLRAGNRGYVASWDISFSQLKNRKYISDIKNKLKKKVGS